MIHMVSVVERDSPSRHGPPPWLHSGPPQDYQSPSLSSLRNPWPPESSLTHSARGRQSSGNEINTQANVWLWNCNVLYVPECFTGFVGVMSYKGRRLTTGVEKCDNKVFLC